MSETQPTGEQIRFRSANTGDHVLDTYLESAEIGGRTLTDLLDDLFDPSNNGVFRSSNFEFRFNSNKIQFRVGQFASATAGYTDVTTFFAIKGTFSTSTAYNNFDVVTTSDKDVYIVHGLSTATTYSSESNFISSANTTKIVDVSEAKDWAIKTDGIVSSTGYSAKAWAIGGNGVDNASSGGAAKDWATKTGGTVNGSDFSAKHYATTGNVATVSGAISNINTVAGLTSAIATVNSNATNINTVAGINTAISTVSGISANVTSVANIASNVTSVAGNASNINTTAGISSNVTTVAGISANVTTVAGNTTNINTVAGISSNVTTVAGISSSISSAGANATLAQNYALKTDGAVESSNYSSKAWAIGGTGVTDTSGSGSAKSWAVEADAVDGSEHSAKSYAISGSAISSGSAKQWALGGGSGFTTSTAVSGGVYSAKYYAEAAATAQASASGSLSAFQAVYLGSGSSNPSSGHTAGDLFFNTSDNKLKYFNGSAWISIEPQTGVTQGQALAFAIAL